MRRYDCWDVSSGKTPGNNPATDANCSLQGVIHLTDLTDAEVDEIANLGVEAAWWNDAIHVVRIR